MQTSGRHTLVSVVGTVAMVLLTVLLAAQAPAPAEAPAPQTAAFVTEEQR